MEKYDNNNCNLCRDAFLSGVQEKVVYIPCIVPDQSRPDYLATVDVDPSSQTFSQVINKKIKSSTK
jgi:hypothetical protein